jgi:small GTP-binding protein
MASYDSVRGCYVIRVVYDGPGYAGKTTNLQHVCKIVPKGRRTEMTTPAQLKGRTMFFDWLEVDGPKQGPRGLKFQLITVPGQIERNYRRKPLIEMADVVIFVCDSSPDRLVDTLRTHARLQTSIKQRSQPVPLVVQANKQDVPFALKPEELRKRLALPDETRVVSASATTGQGVEETLRAALRLGVQTMSSGGDVLPFAPAFANADTLFDHVLKFEDTPSDDRPVEVEELYAKAEFVSLDESAQASHLAASSLDALESRARRAAERSNGVNKARSRSAARRS